MVWLMAVATIGPGMRSSERTNDSLLRSHRMTEQSYPPLPVTMSENSCEMLTAVMASLWPCRLALRRKSVRREVISHTFTTPDCPPDTRITSSLAQAVTGSLWWFSTTDSVLSVSTDVKRMLQSQWFHETILPASGRRSSLWGPSVKSVTVGSLNSIQNTELLVSCFHTRLSDRDGSFTIAQRGVGSGVFRLGCWVAHLDFCCN